MCFHAYTARHGFQNIWQTFAFILSEPFEGPHMCLNTYHIWNPCNIGHCASHAWLSFLDSFTLLYTCFCSLNVGFLKMEICKAESE